MAEFTDTNTTSGTAIATVELSPVILPGTLFFGLYDDQGMELQGGFRIDELVLSRHMPLVSQDFADHALLLKDVALAFSHAISGTADPAGDNRFSLALTLVIGGKTVSELKLSLAGSTIPTPPNPPQGTPGNTSLVANPNAGAAPQNVAPDAVFWINIQKSIGPVHLGRIGFNCIGDDVQVLLDAGLATASFSVELSGLAATVPIFGLDSIEDIHLSIKGLDVAFSTAALSIEGGLLYSDLNGQAAYTGGLSIKTADFTVMALGAFTTIASGGHTDNSLFGFAFVDYPIGGPPAFFITGLSAGFGYNRSVKAPAVADVGTFPLLAGLSDPKRLGLPGGGVPAASQLETVLATINNYIVPDLGEYWFAAGVQFTSFELIHSNVVAVVEVGKAFEILVLGKSSGAFPPTGVTYGYVELDLEVVFQPDAGLFKAEAVLASSSYVLDPNCHLTGGFAFYCWFGPSDHAGDFVFTVGGYHPAFAPPDYYPVVPRLGFNWNVSDEVTIKGSAYFALTPSCIMAGGALEALYQSGNLRAWFTAYADFLIYWKPFYFTAGIGVDVGVSYHVHFLFVSTTLHFELGATIDLYGPPTGGIVHIHLWVISFSVAFGASAGAGDQKLDWAGFRTMLSQPKQDSVAASARVAGADAQTDLCQLTVSSGLANQVQDADGSVRWLVRADEFVFDATSAVPMTQLTLDATTLHAQTGTLAIRPMKVGAITSSVATLAVTSADGNPIVWKSPQPYTRALPQALWGAPVDHPAQLDPNGKLIDSCLVGFKSLAAVAAYQPKHTGQIDVAAAFTYVTLMPADGKLPRLPVSAAAPSIPTHAAVTPDARHGVIDPALAASAATRAQVVAALATLTGFPVLDERLAGFDATANFATDPLVGPLAFA